MNNVNLILHAHLPYVRHLEYEKFLEENWLFESLNESYIPLLRKLLALNERNVKYKISICFSPTLTTMLLDKPLQERFVSYMESRIELGEKEVERTEREDCECHEMAIHYLETARDNLSFYEEYDRNILQGFKQLAALGRIELLATAATHAYLPLYKDFPTAINAQLEVGIQTHQETFKMAPRGFWLPECGFYPGLDRVLVANGIDWCNISPQSVITSPDCSRYAGYEPVVLPSGLYGFARDWNITNLIWSGKFGYPCDPDYREFYRDIGYYLPLEYVKPYIHEPEVRVFTGYKYYAITDRSDNKHFYNMKKAGEKVRLHVDNFIYNIERKGVMLEANGIEDPTFNLTFDAELFGHRWFEGLDFLSAFLEKTAQSNTLELTTPSSLIDSGVKNERLRINESSWGQNGGADTWLDSSNAWIYHHTHEAIKRMQELTHRFPDQGSLKGRFLKQASREVLLAMANDWPCIIHDNTSVTYAEKRLTNHLGSFNVVYTCMCRNTVNTEWLINAEKRNAIFPNLDYKLFDPDKF